MTDRVRLRPVETEPSQYGLYFVSEKKHLEIFSTGCALLDSGIGGGWCLGKIGNIVGDKSTCKTLLASEAAANFSLQYPDGKIYYREPEAAFDKEYGAALGFPVDKMDFGDDEDFFTVEDFERDLTEKIGEISKLGVPGLYILDSLDALSDEAELKRDIGKDSYNTSKAKLMGQLFRKLIQHVKHSRMCVLIISQERDQIGVMFGKKTTRSGGRALDFYASHIVWLHHKKTLTKEIRGIERPTGIKIRAKVEKNKTSLPLREVEFDFIFGLGIDNLISGAEWLKSVKRLDVLGLETNKELVDWLKEVNKKSDSEYWAEVAKLNSTITTVWQEIEKELLPQRRKYNNE